MTAAGADDGAALEALVDLLGRRHSLALVWALRGGAQPFGVLADGVGAAPPQVTQRLRELREAGIVEVDEGGDYRLSTEGRRLQGQLEPLATWAGRWASLRPRQRVARNAATRGRGEP